MFQGGIPISLSVFIQPKVSKIKLINHKIFLNLLLLTVFIMNKLLIFIF